MLNKVAGLNGVGWTDLVEDRVIGLKSRGIYEAPAQWLLWDAHLALDELTLPRDVRKEKEMLAVEIAYRVYGGKWFSPKTQKLFKKVDKTREKGEGTIRRALYKGNIMAVDGGRKSPNLLYNPTKASMDTASPDLGAVKRFISKYARKD